MIEMILRDHLSRYPKMQIQDVYKLLHQAALGSEHAVSDSESARRWLDRELTEMGEGIREPWIDPISPDGKIARIHLRSFIAAGYDPDLLLDAFVRTANEYRGDVHLLEQYWQVVSGTAGFSVQEMNDFIGARKEKNYPAMHHSAEYNEFYRPAYRIVSLDFCPKTWK